MNIIDSQITFCGVSDLDRTALFWEQCMGLRMVLDQGTCRIYNTIGQSYLGFCQRDHVVAGEQVILTIVSDEVDAWYDRLAAAGVEIEHAPRDNPDYGIYHFFARDPDGYRVEIQRFHDPDWNVHRDQ